MLALVMLIALAQGTLYLLLLPPWQHYDEPTHFEYALLVADLGRLPLFGDLNSTMRRDIATSMIQHRFFWNLPSPPFLNEQFSIGITELAHPPAYYALVGLALRPFRHLDVDSQLYIARSVSLVLFLLTVAAAAGIMRDLTPPGHILRWAVPLALALLPTFADLMTSVNNDVGAILLFSLFLWGGVRMLRFGVSWRNTLWVLVAALLAVFTKTTSSIALLLAPFVLCAALWARQGWRWRWFVGIGLLAGIGLAVATLGWGDAAYWYRGAVVQSHTRPTRAARADAPLGAHVLALDATNGLERKLINPVFPQDVRQLAGTTVTVGGWMWASRPVKTIGPGIRVVTGASGQVSEATKPISLTTSPAFVAWTFDVPEQAQSLYYVLAAPEIEADEPPLTIFLDGAVLATGDFSSAAPVFDGAAGSSGIWDGRSFNNLLRGASAEQAWPRPRPWADDLMIRYTRRSPSQVLFALLDVERIVPRLISLGARPAFDGMVDRLAWGHVQIEEPGLVYALRGIGAIALLGCVAWAVRARRAAALWPAVVMLAIIGLGVWINTIMRPLPLLDDRYVVPATRYAFPAIVPTMLALVGGWWALWPARARSAAVLLLMVAIAVLNGVTVYRVWSFYQSISAP